MPRAHNLEIQGEVLHLTHRCHNRKRLLKFARDRDAYRSRLREALGQYAVGLLDYCLTCNHIHLLVEAEERREISGLMQKVAGETARAYNRRKARQNAFWGDNYHATVVEGGGYLWRCLVYIELNMVRCGVVGHPRDWEWVGYREIIGERQRYRLLDLERLVRRLGAASLEEVRRNLETTLSQRIAEGLLAREGCWTESLAVGSRAFLSAVEPQIQSRREIRVEEVASELWALRESPIPYGLECPLKIVAKA
ncbi:MAG TPA: transposase [Candidatus Paceibacterota bacterium]|nr:transposase [Verrucomicrobiota bacterium]HRY50878.1 transposase [Candidatus Paceibacterota bacterium]